jgi:nicotinamide-nucleotide amidase
MSNKVMHCEIVTIGSELLLGQIVDTNASYLAEALNRVGMAVEYHTTVGDSKELIVEALDLGPEEDRPGHNHRRHWTH